MLVEKELSGLTPIKETLLTIGVFDGVHVGHQTLLSRLVRQAQERHLLSGVITFRQHPQKLLTPQESIPFLTSLPERIHLIKATGVDLVLTLTFSAELAHLGAQPFVLLLQHYLKMQGLVLGFDFAMGKNREGSLEALRVLTQRLGFCMDVVGPVRVGGEIVSSTAIRQALAQGDIDKATSMLGRYFSLEGRVITGNGRGADLGFPTANLDIDPVQALPANGVYVTLSHLGGQTLPSVTNIGHRPTFSGTEHTVEVHLLDFKGDLYRHEMKIDIIQKLRDEKRFDTAADLQKQIAEDIVRARETLESALK